jgi:iron complex transport system substrate-binding protein
MSYKSVNSLSELISIAEQQDANLAESWFERVELIKHKVKFVKNRPRILCLESIDPIVVAGKWIPELIDNAGGEHLLVNATEPPTTITFNELLASDPDGIIIAINGNSKELTRTQLEMFIHSDDWKQLKAVQKGHVFVADGDKYFYTPGEGLIETAEMIAEILQVNQFFYGMEGQYWEQMPVIL